MNFLYRKNPLFYFFRKAVSAFLVVAFGLSMAVPPSGAQLLANLPAPGQMLWLSSGFLPPVLKGMTVHAENPLLFDFIVDRGQDKINNGLLKDESTKLIKYFLTAMTIPDKDAWVNLSPYEKDRIIPDALGQTEMGRQMLEQDYILKQLSASLTNPDKELGQKFWHEVRSRAQKQFGTAEVPLNTFNKVWIVPDGATVVEKDGFAYIAESKLKVMLDEDYLALQQSHIGKVEPIQKLSTQIFRELILPQLNKELNEGKNFAPTRQVYQSVILAAWYKKALKDSLLGRIYADKSKVEGVESDVIGIKQKVYEQYLDAFKKGVYNVIKEDSADSEAIPRKYFSGGLQLGMTLNSNDLKIVRGSADVNRAASAIVQAGDQIALVSSSAAESKGEQSQLVLNALDSQRAGRINDIYNVVYAKMGKKYLDPFGNPLATSQEYGTFAPSSLREVLPLFRQFGVGPGKKFVDLGSGDGRVALAAALLGANAIGVEKDPQLVAIAKQAFARVAQEINVPWSVGFYRQDISQYSLQDSNAPDVIYYYQGGGVDVDEAVRNKIMAGTTNPNAILIVAGFATEYDLFPELTRITTPEFEDQNWTAVYKVPAASSSVYVDPKNLSRGLPFLERAYGISSFLDQRKDQAKVRLLLVGVGYGVAAMQLALKYPNLEIVAVNKEQGTWYDNIAAALAAKIDQTVYSPAQLNNAFNRIHVVEPLDIEDAQAREASLGEFADRDGMFDMVFFETSVTWYLKDQVRTIESLFNERVKVGGVYGFEIYAAQPHQDIRILLSQELPKAFSKSGDIKMSGVNREVPKFFTVERTKSDAVNVPVTKVESRRYRPGDIADFDQPVYSTVYQLTSPENRSAASSALSAQYNHPADRIKPSENSARFASELSYRAREIFSTFPKTPKQLRRSYSERDSFIIVAVGDFLNGQVLGNQDLFDIVRALNVSPTANENISQLTGEGLLRWLYAEGILRNVREQTVPDIYDSLRTTSDQLDELILSLNADKEFGAFRAKLQDPYSLESLQDPRRAIEYDQAMPGPLKTALLTIYERLLQGDRKKYAGNDFLQVLSLTHRSRSQRNLEDIQSSMKDLSSRELMPVSFPDAVYALVNELKDLKRPLTVRYRKNGQTFRSSVSINYFVNDLASDFWVDDLRIEGVPTTGEYRNIESVPQNILDKFDGQWISERLTPQTETLITDAIIEFRSGFKALVSGNAEMLIVIAANPDIVRVERSSGKRWMKRIDQVTAEQRKAGYEWQKEYLAQISPHVKPLSETGLVGQGVAHGTLSGFVNSVKLGALDFGKGFGGVGLYLDLELDQRVARDYALRSVDDAQARIAMAPEKFEDYAGAKNPVVMVGQIKAGTVEIKVAQLEVSPNTDSPDLKNGKLPPLWADDPNLQAVILQAADILDLRGMRNPFNLNTDRMLVLHSSAGPAIEWREVKDVTAASSGVALNSDGASMAGLLSDPEFRKTKIAQKNLTWLMAPDPLGAKWEERYRSMTYEELGAEFPVFVNGKVDVFYQAPFVDNKAELFKDGVAGFLDVLSFKKYALPDFYDDINEIVGDFIGNSLVLGRPGNINYDVLSADDRENVIKAKAWVREVFVRSGVTSQFVETLFASSGVADGDFIGNELGVVVDRILTKLKVNAERDVLAAVKEGADYIALDAWWRGESGWVKETAAADGSSVFVISQPVLNKLLVKHLQRYPKSVDIFSAMGVRDVQGQITLSPEFVKIVNDEVLYSSSGPEGGASSSSGVMDAQGFVVPTRIPFAQIRTIEALGQEIDGKFYSVNYGEYRGRDLTIFWGWEGDGQRIKTYILQGDYRNRLPEAVQLFETKSNGRVQSRYTGFDPLTGKEYTLHDYYPTQFVEPLWTWLQEGNTVNDAEAEIIAAHDSQVSASSPGVGGINFDPTLLNLQIKRDGRGVPLPLPQQNLENINIKGLYPVIINILPVNAQTLPILGQLQTPASVALSKG